MTPEGALTPCRHMVSGSVSLRSQRFFSPFPRGTSSLSVASQYLALRRGRRRFTRRFTCAALLRNSLGAPAVFGYGSLTLWGAVFQPLHLTSALPHRAPTTPEGVLPVWASPLSFATTDGIDSLSFPPVTEMFHFTGSCVSAPILFSAERPGIPLARLPHSEIPGSKRICRYPRLIAAYHVLHRLLAPRHPLCALCNLIFRFVENPKNPAVKIRLQELVPVLRPPSGRRSETAHFQLQSSCFLPCMQMSKNFWPSGSNSIVSMPSFPFDVFYRLYFEALRAENLVLPKSAPCPEGLASDGGSDRT